MTVYPYNGVGTIVFTILSAFGYDVVNEVKMPQEDEQVMFLKSSQMLDLHLGSDQLFTLCS